MPLLTGYGSSSDSSDDEKLTPKRSTLELAPAAAVAEYKHSVHMVVSDDNSVRKNAAAFVQRELMDEVSFQAQKRAYEMNASDDEGTRPKGSKVKRSRKKGSPEDVDGYKGPWASYSETSSESDDEADSVDTPEEEPQYIYKAVHDDVETTKLYAKSETDYLGRTYMHIPQDLGIDLLKDPGSQNCYVPKRKIHTWAGHEKGTQKLQFFPKSGHMLLSCGNDNNIFLWDTYHKRELLRGYFGHRMAVKDVDFNHDGSRFLSCSYDKTVKLWDTEKGVCLSRYKLQSLPNVVRYNTNVDKNHEFVVGLTNNKIEHFDSRTEETVQTYDHHMGAINDICFVDNGNKFMSSSDDKTLRVWGWQVNMPIKHISDPSQHSMPRLSLHPSSSYVVAQSMDNTIVTFSARDKFKRSVKKKFSGHKNAAYAVGLDFTPDGKILMSGDSNGFAYFWDWKTVKVVTKLKVDDMPISCIQAHPQETSKVAISGAKGKIYYYE
ncbi:unnamed protein product [Kuraishia capsulata CBS 1993]|uniref:Pre-mRNA-processing factor 17 n=1 Tax=Kuraishia capsulata CBS 1993 TaxID=1382522 RepID=W6MS18_9ASCO|nr:uncharacterized protein KUCA_T00005569001 [Kuraishia capsulata CBS 1993]CDK29576.1 unnamed protein product [Kuraishia capsulata CBS 1993]